MKLKQNWQYTQSLVPRPGLRWAPRRPLHPRWECRRRWAPGGRENCLFNLSQREIEREEREKETKRDGVGERELETHQFHFISVLIPKAKYSGFLFVPWPLTFGPKKNQSIIFNFRLTLPTLPRSTSGSITEVSSWTLVRPVRETIWDCCRH